ncbi:DUF3047 domain-containing protein [Palleronia caenipelagi]|uniref:DUF3047 domain-containing protein n=2 Tax=Palleronia caenipelagi TaxID=2489174 RepID=A0A547Q8C3_9RHOB|nr:DUF3047 domain-containing protein [Palleronia caenipelagi]
MFRNLACTLLLTLTPVAASAGPIAFDGNWQNQKFPFQAANSYQTDGKGVTVTSQDSVSLLYRRTPDASSAKSARWSWSVTEGVPATDLRRKGGDDRNLALYFVFSDEATAGTLQGASLRSLLGAENVRVLVYVWGGNATRGAVLDSPYLGSRGKTVVLRSAGTGSATEQVNFDADLKKAFGERPAVLLGAAISADSDDTDSRISARIDSLRLD